MTVTMTLHPVMDALLYGVNNIGGYYNKYVCYIRNNIYCKIYTINQYD